VLSAAHLESAHLGQAHLEGASLLNANLAGACSRSPTSNAFLWEAPLKGADLMGGKGDLTGAKLTQEQLNSAPRGAHPPGPLVQVRRERGAAERHNRAVIEAPMCPIAGRKGASKTGRAGRAGRAASTGWEKCCGGRASRMLVGDFAGTCCGFS
jgi:hypothetical protein